MESKKEVTPPKLKSVTTILNRLEIEVVVNERSFRYSCVNNSSVNEVAESLQQISKELQKLSEAGREDKPKPDSKSVAKPKVEDKKG